MLTPKNTAMISVTGGTLAALAISYFNVDIDRAKVMTLFSDTASNQIAQAGFFFSVAAWLHSGRVKKEIRVNFVALTMAINQVADAFKEDLKRHGDRIDNLSFRVQTLEGTKLPPTKE